MSGSKSTHTGRQAATPTAPWIHGIGHGHTPTTDSSQFAQGDIEHRSLPGLDVFVVRSRTDVVQDHQPSSLETSKPSFLVSLQVEGHATVRQDEREALLGPGDFALCDSSRPYRLSLEAGSEQIVLRLPANALLSAVRELGRWTATRVPSEHIEGLLMVEMIRTLWRDYETLEPATRLAVSNGVVNLVIAGLHTLAPADAAAASDASFAHLERIKRLVDAQLSDPDLTVGSIARQLGLSSGHLHRVFKSEAVPLAHYIWLRRLEACSRDLLDPRLSSRSIGEIAYRRGFKDAAHFSRSFKDRFGISPREWRGTYGER
ncbi:helix-turn-helix domain-containing protein [Caldimonas sp. KR1-144]|uniref:AraC-like ligand-binding domain-containing protein n=1 Tax=Caldimonas sp. KR1-144 TaxID=3400911 RepID=UPI003C084554